MKTEKNILVAFILNLAFSIFEFFGGIFTGSVAILSDAVHDIGDAISIGLSFFLERKSKKQPNEKYTYGYGRFSVLGGLITTLILLVGSGIVIYNAIGRIIAPVEINYNGMIIFAVVGTCVNFLAAYLTKEGESINQRAVNLHMLEDVLGWVVVLIGAVVMRFTDFYMIDPIMSIGVALFITVGSLKNLKEILDLFLIKVPKEIDQAEIRAHIMELDGITDVHHIHLWTIDGHTNYATMHIVVSEYSHEIKDKIREELKEHGVSHATLELEEDGEKCQSQECKTEALAHHGHHHHHH